MGKRKLLRSLRWRIFILLCFSGGPENNFPRAQIFAPQRKLFYSLRWRKFIVHIVFQWEAKCVFSLGSDFSLHCLGSKKRGQNAIELQIIFAMPVLPPALQPIETSAPRSLLGSSASRISHHMTSV